MKVSENFLKMKAMHRVSLNQCREQRCTKSRIETLISYAQSSPVGMGAIFVCGDSSDLEVLKAELESLCGALEALKGRNCCHKNQMKQNSYKMFNLMKRR